MAGMVLLIVPLSTALAGRPDYDSDPAVYKQSIGNALGEALGYRSYILLLSGFFVCGFHVAFITVHLPAYLADLGIGIQVAAWAIGLVGLFNIVGSYASGVLGGKFSKRYLLSTIYFLRAVVIALFIAVPATTVTVLLFAAAMGVLWLSTVPLTSGLVAVMFGPRYMATLFGVVFFSHQVGSFLGVWLGGYLYDRTGSYDVVWWLGIALGLFAALIHLPISERPIVRLAPAT
jgi:MFS family permease